MDNVFRIILCVHIAFGAVALVIARLAMVTSKGGLWHRRWGKTYFWAMAGVSVTALVMCWLRTGLFMFLVATFSFYLALTGYSALRRKKPTDRPGALDWSAAMALLLAGGGLLVTCLLTTDSSKQWVRGVFGSISLLFGASDIRQLVKPSLRERAWWFSHMTRFLGAYIATVTAFSVVNFQFLHYSWRWLWPTAIGIPGIILWRRYYAKKFARQRIAA